MTHLTVHKAQPIGDQHIKDVEIEIVHLYPAERYPADWMAADADVLARLLISSLPGGTLHRLTSKLLIHMAGTLVVPSRTLAAPAAEQEQE